MGSSDSAKGGTYEGIGQYAALVALIDSTKKRRADSSRFYITLISGLVGLLMLSSRVSIPAKTQALTTMLVGFIGLVACLAWWLSLRSLRRLARVRTEIVIELERQLPFQFFEREDHLMGRDKKGLKLSDLELFIPALIAIPVIFVLVVGIMMSL